MRPQRAVMSALRTLRVAAPAVLAGAAMLANAAGAQAPRREAQTLTRGGDGGGAAALV